MIKMIEELEGDVIRMTLDKERWYFRDDIPYPSVTWILEYFPKGIWYHIWLADKMQSYDEVRAVLKQRGEEGTMVHWGMENYLNGLDVTYHDEHPEFKRGFTPKEWEMVLDGKRWCDKYEPVVQYVELPVFGEEPKYAGTLDMGLLIDGKKFTHKNELIYGDGDLMFFGDWKTSAAIYDTHKAQIAAYAQPAPPDIVGIIRLGSKHKVGYEFWHCPHDLLPLWYQLFRAAYKFWQHDNPNPAPKIIEVPMKISIREKIK